MADIEPTYYDVGDLKGTGMEMEDQHKALYDLWKAVVAICNNIDEDGGVIGTDYMSKIGTDLDTAFAKLRTPTNGPIT